jgi:transcriptional regulator with XRE-family HTH domain
MATEIPDLAVALSVLRVVRGWSQEDLAKASGIRVSSLSQYERSKKIPELVSLRKVVGAMGYPLSAIEEAQNFVYRIRQRRGEIGDEASGASEVEAQIPELGAGAPATVRWEIEQVAAGGGRLVTRLLRLLLLLVARLWATRDAGASEGLRSAQPEVDMTEVYAILSQRFESGETDVAARHDEHQP